MGFTHNSKTAEKEPTWGDVDKGKLPRAAFAGEGDPDKKSTWSFPHHWVEGGKGEDENGCYTEGTMFLHRGGLNAAWSAANGGRSGVKASAEVIRHLQAHRKALGLDKGEEKQNALPEVPTWARAELRATYKDTGVGVDREKGVIHGVVMAEEGPFKDRRGEFNEQSLKDIVRLCRAEPKGLKSRFCHPTLSEDGLGKYLGRVQNARRDVVTRPAGEGMLKETKIVRGDLHLDPTALDTPPKGGKPLGEYVMDLAESDPDALGHSLVLKPRRETRLNPDGTPVRDDDGNVLPELWYPEKLHACDVVDTGDATNSFLYADFEGLNLPDDVVRQASELLSRQFGDQPRNVVRARCLAWLDRYLAWRYCEEEYDPARDPKLRRERLKGDA